MLGGNLIRLRTVIALVLMSVMAALAALAVAMGFGTYAAQSDNAGNTVTSAPSFDNTGYGSFSSQVATTGGDGNGFETNPTYASGDGPLYASNIDGPGDRHVFYDFGLAPPSGSTIEGIRVRLDWWLDAVEGDNTMSVELSWDGGTSWTSAKTDAVESATERTGVLGAAADMWGRVWTVTELADANFRLRVTCACSASPQCDSRDYYLDWVTINVYYTPP
jgi:hypothetical protein